MDIKDKKQIVVTCDMDGVVAASQQPILDAFNEHFGTTFAFSDWNSFDLIKDEAIRLSNQSLDKVGEWLFSSEIMYRSRVIRDAYDSICFLGSIGIFLDIVTSRPTSQYDTTHAWIKENLPPIRGVYVRNDTHSFNNGNEYKINMVGELKAIIHIDDDPSVASALSERKSAGILPELKHIFLVDRPWNDSYISPQGIVHTVGNWRNADYGWKDIVKLITL